jgi:chemotaxis signal transduction protein
MSVSKSETDDAVSAGAAEHVEFVRVHLGSETYVFELGYVKKLVRRPSLTHVPLTLPTIAGVTVVQGDLTAAINGRALLGGDNRDGGHSPQILVVFGGMAPDQTAGILVDGIEGIENHPVDVIAPASAADTEPDYLERDWFKAVIDGETWVFDPEGLIEAARSGRGQQVN